MSITILFYKSIVNLNSVSNILIGKGKFKHQKYKQVTVLNLCPLGLLNIFPLNKNIRKGQQIDWWKNYYTYVYIFICIYINIHKYV